MTRVLVTGLPAAGKSSLLIALEQRGLLVVETDNAGWTTENGLLVRDRMRELLLTQPTICVAATAANQSTFYDLFDHIVLLSVPTDVMVQRITERTQVSQQGLAADQELILRNIAEMQPGLRLGATIELDGRRPLRELADIVEQLMVNDPPEHQDVG